MALAIAQVELLVQVREHFDYEPLRTDRAVMKSVVLGQWPLF